MARILKKFLMRKITNIIIGFIITKMKRLKLLVNLQLNHNAIDKLRGIKNDKFPNQYI